MSILKRLSMVSGNIYFKNLCELFETIETTSSRIEIIDQLYKYLLEFDESNREDMVALMYLSTAELFPAHMNKESNIGESIILNMLAEISQIRLATIKSKYKEVGDFGAIAFKYASKPIFNIKFKPITTTEVYKKLVETANVEGKEAKKQKMKILLSLIRKMSPIERKYFARILDGKLKIGLALQTILISVAKYFANYYRVEGDFAEDIKTAYNRLPIFEKLIEVLFKYPITELLNHCTVQLGIPLRPMLAQPIKHFDEISKKLKNDDFYGEYKYDGERIQVHKYGNVYKAFSRNGLNLLPKYPDIKKYIIDLNDKNFIIDCEIVAYDYKERKILPFQILSTRKRKLEAGEKIEIDTQLIIFDILFFDGQSCLNEFYEQRREILLKNFSETERIKFAKSQFFTEIDEVEDFFNRAIGENCEGLMIKKVGDGSFYMPSKRTHNWIKLKKDYMGGAGDTFDLVVLGAYKGKGKRLGFYGGFLMGTYNEKTEKFESICKLGTGFNDDDLKIVSEKIDSIRIEDRQKNYDIDKTITPDIWVKPELIWEIKAAELTLSPIYSCSKNIESGSRGISLRFPRFLRERDDKSISDMTTSEFVYNLYHNDEKEERNNSSSSELSE